MATNGFQPGVILGYARLIVFVHCRTINNIFVQLTWYPNSGISGIHVQYKHSDPGRGKWSPYDVFLPDFLLIFLRKKIYLPPSRFLPRHAAEEGRCVTWQKCMRGRLQVLYKKIKTERKISGWLLHVPCLSCLKCDVCGVPRSGVRIVFLTGAWNPSLLSIPQTCSTYPP